MLQFLRGATTESITSSRYSGYHSILMSKLQALEDFTEVPVSLNLYKFRSGTRPCNLQLREKEWLNGKGILGQLDR